MSKQSLAVFISGTGSNLQAIIDADVKIDLVVSNNPKAAGIEKSKRAGIKTAVIDHTLFATRSAFELMLEETLAMHHIQCIALAGFMRRLTPDFVNSYAGKIINLHPSLLPRYPGLHTHRRVLKNQDKEHGISIHFVSAILDDGPLIIQESIPVSPTDTEMSLKKRIQTLEHIFYPKIVKLLSEDKLQLSADGSVEISD